MIAAETNECLLNEINRLMSMLKCECCHAKAAFLYEMKGPLCQECFDWIFVDRHNDEFTRTFASREAYLNKIKEIA